MVTSESHFTMPANVAIVASTSTRGAETATFAVPVTVTPNSGVSFVNVSKAVTGLTPGVTYHYRLAVTNAVGTSYTSDATFVIPEGTLAFDPAAGSVINVREDVVDHLVRIPIIRTGTTGGSVSVTASTANGTALAPSDYAAVVNATVTFGDTVSSDDLDSTCSKT